MKSCHFFPLVFIEEFFIDFRTRFIRRRYTSFKKIIYVFSYSYAHSIPLADSKSFLFNIFGNCCCQLNFAVIFRVNDGKCQTDSLVPIFANFLLCSYCYYY